MRRSSPALFELMRRGDAAGGPVRVPAAPAAAPATPPPAPVASPPPAAREPVSEERPAGPAWASESEPGVPSVLLALQRRLSVTVSTALLAAGGVLALAVIVWSAGYTAGQNREKEDTKRQLGREAPPVVREPLTDNVRVNPDLLANTQAGTPDRAQPKPAPPPAPSVQPAAIAGDPREAGRNYLQLVTTDRDEADRLIAFLAENGVGAFAIGVDRSGKPTNNPARFMVFCNRGITREELRDRAPARTELERTITALGQRWKQEHKGSSDFRDTLWSKYSP